MHPLMQAFRQQQLAERAELALASLVADRPAPPGVTRRAVLASGGLVVAIGWLPQAAQAGVGQGPEGGAARAAFAPNQFVSIGTDNLVTIVDKHHEMGQGNTTGLATLLADEPPVARPVVLPWPISWCLSTSSTPTGRWCAPSTPAPTSSATPTSRSACRARAARRRSPTPTCSTAPPGRRRARCWCRPRRRPGACRPRRSARATAC